MRQIAVSEAKELLFSSDAKYVSQEQSSIYYDNFSGRAPVDTYMTCECLVVKSGADWHIHAISNKSDVSSAIQEVSKLMDPNADKLMVLTWDNIPDELTDKRGAYKFVRGYLPNSDPSVRELTTEDYEQVKTCCAYDSEDNQIGKNIANDFISYYNDFINDDNTINLGLFEEDNLVGFV